MFEQSHLTIAAIDAFTVFVAVMVLVSLVRQRKELADATSATAVICFACGIAVFTLFYFNDFLLVAIVPLVVPHALAENLIAESHPNLAWAMGSYGIVLIAYGFSAAQHRMLARMAEHVSVATGLEQVVAGYRENEKRLLAELAAHKMSAVA